MKILVLSDTHGDLSYVTGVIDTIKNTVKTVLFCGDQINDMKKLKNKYPDVDFHGVVGNCDYQESGHVDKCVVVSGKNILITHGHVYQVKGGCQKLTRKAEEVSADICVYGHTHTPKMFEQSNILYLNPGSISEPRSTDYPTYGILDIDGDRVTASIVICDPVGYKTMMTF